MAAGYGQAVVEDMIAGITGSYYQQDCEAPSITGLVLGFAVAALGLLALMGTLRLRRGWYLFTIVLHVLGVLLLAGTAVWVAVMAARASGPVWDARTTAIWHGWRIEYSLASIFGLLAVVFCVVCLQLVLLLLPRVRALFPRPARDDESEGEQWPDGRPLYLDNWP